MRKPGKLHVESCEEMWEVKLDDVEQVEKEYDKELYGSEDDVTVSGELYCFNCAEITEVPDGKSKPQFCPYCAADFSKALEAKIHLASIIDDAWPEMCEEDRKEYKRMYKRLASVNPEFRGSWKRTADRAALRRLIVELVNRTKTERLTELEGVLNG